MAVIWADFPSGQRGLYGTNKTRMTNGVWAALQDDFSGLTSLVDDPDPLIGNTGVVLKTVAGGGSSHGAARFAYGTASATKGVAFRFFCDNLPANANSCPYFAFVDASNVNLCAFRINSDGSISVYKGANGDVNGVGVLLGSSSSNITANAWTHIEAKVTNDASAGAVELRVNGVPVLTLAGQTMTATNISQVRFGARSAVNDGTKNNYWKEFVFWDTTGTVGNDFQGSVGVYDHYPDADDTLNWDVSRGTTGFNLIDDNTPSNALVASGFISNGAIISIGTTYYHVTAGSVDAGTPAGTSANPWYVTLGGTTMETLENLFHAINATGTAGVTYSTALTEHPSVSADGFTDTVLNVYPDDGLTTTMAFTENRAVLAWSSDTTFIDGPSDASYISADNTLPAESIFTMTDLPPDITSIRAVIPIGRMRKTDGGDCNMQMAVTPNGTDYDSGADRGITTVDTFWWDVSHLSPATAVAWTPTEVNNIKFRIDRTL